MAESAKAIPKRHWFHVPIQVVVGGLCLYWYWHIPVPNKAVLWLGGVAALMALVEMRPLHKAAYFLLVTALIFTENRAIDKDRHEFSEAESAKRAAENAQFSKIGTTITDNVQKLLDKSDAQFSATSTQQRKQFVATMERFQINVNEITGGTSFPVVHAPLIAISPNTFPLMMRVNGRYDLQDVQVEVVKLPEPGFGTQEWAERSLAGKNSNVQSAFLGNVSHTSGKQIPISVTASDDGTITEYSVNVYARNRMTHESLRIRKNATTGRWESSFRVIDGRTEKTLEQSKPEWRGFVILPPK
jgi:hypothetical protein